MSLTSDLRYAIELASNAGKIVLQRFGRVARLTKRHAEAVTDADRETQRFIVSGLRKQYPGDGIVGEENDTGDAITFDCPHPDGRVWVVDPIDGTNNFLAGFPTFAVCIGLLKAGQPVLGAVYDVCRNVMWSACTGHGAFMGRQRVHASRMPLGESSLLMITSNLLDGDGRVPQYAIRWIGQTRWKLRCIGSAALEAVQVAGGIAHAALTVNGKLWDAVAPAAIVLESGGLMSSPTGQAIFPFDLANYDGGKVPFLAAAPLAQPVLLREMAEHP